ncbi:1294_t:CDS:2 [Ambispora leptoticha]|uniref:1294_t:CDS:1 n=1 Tax=Ambispora leptoticha TaxID=144679 RepID=A0A9N9FVE0_9GLOM|nr:1294_t:CDS:2 [Ambispora leptoticha]
MEERFARIEHEMRRRLRDDGMYTNYEILHENVEELWEGVERRFARIEREVETMRRRRRQQQQINSQINARLANIEQSPRIFVAAVVTDSFFNKLYNHWELLRMFEDFLV